MAEYNEQMSEWVASDPLNRVDECFGQTAEQADRNLADRLANWEKACRLNPELADLMEILALAEQCRTMTACFDRQEAQMDADPADAVELSPEDAARLRALGYVP